MTFVFCFSRITIINNWIESGIVWNAMWVEIIHDEIFFLFIFLQIYTLYFKTNTCLREKVISLEIGGYRITGCCARLRMIVRIKKQWIQEVVLAVFKTTHNIKEERSLWRASQISTRQVYLEQLKKTKRRKTYRE